MTANGRMSEARAGHRSALAAAALELVAAGHPLIPLHTPDALGRCSCGRRCGRPGKHPRGLLGLRSASSDPERSTPGGGRNPTRTSACAATGSLSSTSTGRTASVHSGSCRRALRAAADALAAGGTGLAALLLDSRGSADRQLDRSARQPGRAPPARRRARLRRRRALAARERGTLFLAGPGDTARAASARLARAASAAEAVRTRRARAQARPEPRLEPLRPRSHAR